MSPRKNPTALLPEEIHQLASAVRKLQKTNPVAAGPDPHDLAAAILKKRNAEHLRFWQGEFYR